MKNPKALIDCSILTLTIFLAFPILMVGFNSMVLAAIGLYIVFPITCLSCGVFCGVKNGFQVYYPLLTGVLFLPSMFIFFNLSVWPMLIGYIILALLGIIVGSFFKSNTSGRRPNGRLR